MPEKFTCPVNTRWAKAMVELYPPGWSKKIDALRRCLEEREKVEEEKEEVKSSK